MQVEELRDGLAELAEDISVDAGGALGPVRRRMVRRRRLARVVTATVAAVVVCVGTASVLTLRDDDTPSHLVTRPSPVTPIGKVEGRMIPATTRAGDEITVDLTMPDGRRFEIAYPRTVDVASLGVAMSATIDWPVPPNFDGPHGCCGRDITITYATVDELYPGAAPLAELPGARGSNVRLFAASQRRSPPSPYPTGEYLVFAFGPWTVEVWDNVPGSYANVTPLDDAQRRTWASSLDGHVDAHGFLVLEPKAPLGPVDPRTVQMAFGTFAPGASRLGITPFYCGSEGSDSQVHRRLSDPALGGVNVAWCDPGTGVHIAATGPVDFIDAIDSGFAINELPQ